MLKNVKVMLTTGDIITDETLRVPFEDVTFGIFWADNVEAATLIDENGCAWNYTPDSGWVATGGQMF